VDRRFDSGSTSGDGGTIEASVSAAAAASKPRNGTAPAAVVDQEARAITRVASPRTKAPAMGPQPEPRRASPEATGDEIARVAQAAAMLGVDSERFERFAEKRWGRGWTMNANGRKRAFDEVTRFGNDAAGFQAKVDGELNVLI
jgi:hypothetical protein